MRMLDLVWHGWCDDKDCPNNPFYGAKVGDKIRICMPGNWKQERLMAYGDGYKSNDPYLKTVERMEKDIHMVDPGAFYASAAISLKRIADTLPWILILLACMTGMFAVGSIKVALGI